MRIFPLAAWQTVCKATCPACSIEKYCGRKCLGSDMTAKWLGSSLTPPDTPRSTLAWHICLPCSAYQGNTLYRSSGPLGSGRNHPPGKPLLPYHPRRHTGKVASAVLSRAIHEETQMQSLSDEQSSLAPMPGLSRANTGKQTAVCWRCKWCLSSCA